MMLTALHEARPLLKRHEVPIDLGESGPQSIGARRLSPRNYDAARALSRRAWSY